MPGLPQTLGGYQLCLFTAESDRRDFQVGFNVLAWRYGEDAPIQAAMRADAMLDKGDLDGYALWKRIVKAVRELLSKE